MHIHLEEHQLNDLEEICEEFVVERFYNFEKSRGISQPSFEPSVAKHAARELRISLAQLSFSDMCCGQK